MGGVKPLRASVVGVGHLGRHHARILAELEGIELVAVVDSDQERGEKIADSYGCQWQALIGDLPGSVDFAVIATPTSTHLESSRPFIEHGCPVLIEKPMAPDPQTCAEILALAKSSGAMIGVGHVERFNPAVRRAMELGIKPRFIEAHRLAPYTFRSTDVGVVLDLMIHDIDLVQAWTGEIPSSIDAVGGKTLSTTEDICSVRLRFPSGATANLTASRLSLKPMRRFRVFGPDSYVSVDSQDRYALLVQKAEGFSPQAAAAAAAAGNPADAFKSLLHTEELQLDEDEPLRAELEEFAAAVREGREHLVSGEAGHSAVVTAFKVLESLEQNCWT
ncbi:MAG: hypothetical protein COB96_00375 [Planctomycetota bacterium]|nr:MAG: hypothetical protein COB96_00375 [Planctomycetota bacterium]